MGLLAFIHLFFDLIVEYLFGLFSKKQVIKPANHKFLNMSATDIAKGIRNRKFTCKDIVSVYIERIKEVNSVLNAVVDTRFDEALTEAVVLDERIDFVTEKEFDSRPLLGVPFTAKESTLCKDMSATFGLKQRQNMRADQDAAVIRNMRNAGAILLGVTNVPQLNMWVETHNPMFGITRNPYDSSRAVGGSSGGEAAIIAACGSPFGVGTDIGGSIRIPAYMCGIFGHKCTNGLTDTTGLTFRDGSEMDQTMVTVGPMVRKAEDLLIGIQVLLGKKADILYLSVPVDTKQLKIYYIESIVDPRCSPIRADVQYINNMVVDHFKLTHPVEKLEIPELQYCASLCKYWLGLEMQGFSSDLTNRTGNVTAGFEFLKYVIGRSDFSFSVLLMLMNSQWLPTIDENWAREVTKEIRETLLSKLSTDGVLLFPSWPHTASHHHVSYFRPFNYVYMGIFNVLKLPVTQVPLGLNVDGLPLGIQVVAAPMNDRLCIAIARELEHVFGGYTEPGAYSYRSTT